MSILYQLSANVAWYFLGPALIGVDQLVLVKVVFYYFFAADIAWYFLGPALFGVDQLVLVKVVFLYFFAADIACNTIVIEVDKPNVVLKILFRDYFGTQIASDLRLSLPR